jgi:hypothetical protein
MPRLAILLVAALAAPLAAQAHVRLVSPVSRYGDDMKLGPCGRPGGTRSANVTTFAPGETITVVFDELIDHPGHYRIAFDPDGDDDLAPPAWSGTDWVPPAGVAVLQDLIPDAAGGLTHGAVAVTLPAAPCDACTLQLIQVMTDKPPFDGLDDFYYQCADLVLTSTSPPPTPPPPPAVEPAGGCGSDGGPWTWAGLLGLLLALAAARRSPARR